MDIIILLICTFLIINRLMKMLGQYDPEQERRRNEKTTVIMDLMKKKYDPKTNERVIHPEVISAAELALPEDVRKTITNIKRQDIEFDLEQFINCGQKAYIMYVNALGSKDLETIKNLVEKEFFDKIAIENSRVKTQVKEVKSSTLTGAALYGDRAMLTITFSYSITSFSEDENGNVISGSKDKKQTKTSHITFSRYLTQEKAWRITKDAK